MKNYIDHVNAMKEKDICPFCEEKNHYAIDENDHAVVLPARAPYREDHILVCPKRHADFLQDYTQQEIDDLYALLTKWEILLQKKHGEVVTFLRQGKNFGTTGKSISHLHWHIIPQFKILFAHTQEESNNRQVYTDKELQATTQQLKTNFIT